MCQCAYAQTEVSVRERTIPHTYARERHRFSEIGEFVPIITHAPLEHQTEYPRITNGALGYTQLVYKFYMVFNTLLGYITVYLKRKKKCKKKKNK